MASIGFDLQQPPHPTPIGGGSSNRLAYREPACANRRASRLPVRAAKTGGTNNEAAESLRRNLRLASQRVTRDANPDHALFGRDDAVYRGGLCSRAAPAAPETRKPEVSGETSGLVCGPPPETAFGLGARVNPRFFLRRLRMYPRMYPHAVAAAHETHRHQTALAPSARQIRRRRRALPQRYNGRRTVLAHEVPFRWQRKTPSFRRLPRSEPQGGP
jgi:hypothetical protein